MNHLVDQIKKHPDIHQAGMILCHEGIVRETSRNGKIVTGLRVAVKHDVLQKIISTYKNRPGIIDIRVEIMENQDLHVGDTIMHLVVAGDIRENVFKTMSSTLDDIKATVTHKTEYYE